MAMTVRSWLVILVIFIFQYLTGEQKNRVKKFSKNAATAISPLTRELV
jgi:hypothetical protein